MAAVKGPAMIPKACLSVSQIFDVKQELILAVPGIGFGAPGYFRLSYAVPEDTITGSFEGFKRALAKA